MKIHNYGNDYVQASKFKKESVNNVCNQTEIYRPEPTEAVSTEAAEDISPVETAEEATEAATEEKENRRGRRGKKQSD